MDDFGKWKIITSFFVHGVKVLFFEIGLGDIAFWARAPASFVTFGAGSLRALRAMRRGAAQNEAECICYRTVALVFLISSL